MKKLTGLLIGAALMIAAVNANALSITYDHALTGAGNKEFTSAYSSTMYNYQIETFNDVPQGTVSTVGVKTGLLPWTWSGSASVVNGSLSGKYAAPYGLGTADKSNYISVPNPNAIGSVTVNLGGIYDYFGLWWGSVDSYNTLSFFKKDSNGIEQKIASFTGTQAISPSVANGNQTAPTTNIYINFIDLPDFDSFQMYSNGFAFEADNIAIGNTTAPVPEPGTIALLGLGMAGLAVYGKRRQTNKA